MPEPDCFLRYRCNATFYYIWRENPTYRYWALVAAARRGFKMVLFTTSRWNTFVGGTCAQPSAVLVTVRVRADRPVEIWATSDTVVSEMFRRLLTAKLLQRVGPQQVTHRTKRRRLLESVQLNVETNPNETPLSFFFLLSMGDAAHAPFACRCRAIAEACLTGWPNVQPQGWD